jgi:predicted transcriptional regulator
MSKSVQKNYTQVPNIVVRHPKLSPTEKLIVVFVLGFKNCFASLPFMARTLGFSRSTVQRSMAQLVRDGLIEKTHKEGFIYRYSVNTKSLKNFRSKLEKPAHEIIEDFDPKKHT